MVQTFDFKEYEKRLDGIYGVRDRRPRISSKEAAEILGVSLRTLRRWERAGLTPERDDPAYYRRQYVKAEIEAFVKARQEAKVKGKTKRSKNRAVDLHIDS
jgi:transposase